MSASETASSLRINLAQAWLRKVVLLGTPSFLAIIELWHPMFYGQVFDRLSPIIDRWLLIHLLQLPLFGLLAIAVYLLTQSLQGTAASISRTAMGVFAIFYTAFDAIVGISTGVLIRNSKNLPINQQAIIAKAVEELFYNPIVGDNLSVLAIIGGSAWVVGIIATAIALHQVDAPRFPVILIALSAIFAAHPRPTGPLGMTFFFVAAIWLELLWKPKITE